jgi:hypothetical protein
VAAVSEPLSLEFVGGCRGFAHRPAAEARRRLEPLRLILAVAGRRFG